jgi:hypothetical protein
MRIVDNQQGREPDGQRLPVRQWQQVPVGGVDGIEQYQGARLGPAGQRSLRGAEVTAWFAASETIRQSGPASAVTAPRFAR